MQFNQKHLIIIVDMYSDVEFFDMNYFSPEALSWPECSAGVCFL